MSNWLLAAITYFILIRFIESYPLTYAGGLEDFLIHALLGEWKGRIFTPFYDEKTDTQRAEVTSTVSALISDSATSEKNQDS